MDNRDTIPTYAPIDKNIRTIKILDDQTLELTYKNGSTKKMNPAEAKKQHLVKIVKYTVRPQPLPDPMLIKEINLLPNRKWEVIMKDGTVKIYNEGEVEGLNIPRDFSGTKRNIPIQSVQFRPNNTQATMEISGIDTTNKPLLSINGEVFPYGALNSIKAEDIKEVHVLKEASAIAKWGEKAKEGAIEIILKPGVKAPSNERQYPDINKDEIFKFGLDSLSFDKNENVTIKGVRNLSDDYGMTFTKTEVPPQFAGGTDAWRKFLEKNLNAATPVDSGALAGTYPVIVQFIVNLDGTLEDIKPLTSHGFGMEEEVLRVIKLSPPGYLHSKTAKM